MSKLSDDIIVKAESFPGIKAGLARLEDILKAPSYQVVCDGQWSKALSRQGPVTEWPPGAKSVLVLGLQHPESNLGLDWWGGGNTMGNRQLMEISDALKQWLKKNTASAWLLCPITSNGAGCF